MGGSPTESQGQAWMSPMQDSHAPIPLPIGMAGKTEGDPMCRRCFLHLGAVWGSCFVLVIQQASFRTSMQQSKMGRGQHPGKRQRSLFTEH